MYLYIFIYFFIFILSDTNDTWCLQLALNVGVIPGDFQGDRLTWCQNHMGFEPGSVNMPFCCSSWLSDV